MLAYKGFEKGLICRGYQFKLGLNTTDKAHCVRYGFHCAENPLDCLTYYPNTSTSVYFIVNAEKEFLWTILLLVLIYYTKI